MAGRKAAGPQLLDCRRVSYLQLCEDLVPDAHGRRPLQRVCSIMRRRRSRWLVLHDHLDRERYFRKRYPAAHQELTHLRKHPDSDDSSTRVVQLSFFADCSRATLQRALDGRPQSGEDRPVLLGTCILIITGPVPSPQPEVANPSGPNAPPAAPKHGPYILEALIGIPDVPTLADGIRTVPRRRKQTTPDNFDTVVPSADGVSSHVHVYSRSHVYVAGRRFLIDASYYCQQNGVTSSCAHCCLRSTLWHLGLGGDGNQIPTDELNKVVADAMEQVEPKRPFNPRNGLTRDEIEAVCRHFKAEVLRVEYDTQPQPYFAHSPYELAYMLAESGLPTLLLFKTRDGADGQEARHVVPVVGHTLNSDAWLLAALRRYDHLPQTTLVTSLRHKQHLSTVEWAPQLILHDDLLGPYYNVGPDVLTRPADPRDSGLGRVGTVMAIVPQGQGWARSPAQAQQVASVLFNDVTKLHRRDLPEIWAKRLDERWHADPVVRTKEVVLRTQLVRKDDYVRHLRRHPDHSGQRARPSKTDLEKIEHALAREPMRCVWLVELTLPELFTANVAKVGELVLPLKHADVDVAAKINATSRDQAFDPPPLVSRLLGSLIAYDQDGYTSRISLGFVTHTPLFVRGIDAAGGW